MPEHHDIETLCRAGSSAEAQVIVALLRSRGIPAYVAGQLLQDEFALSQHLMGLSGVDIQVPSSSLGEARKVVEEARRKKHHLEDPPGDSPRPPE